MRGGVRGGGGGGGGWGSGDVALKRGSSPKGSTLLGSFFLRMLYYLGDRKRDADLGNYPYGFRKTQFKPHIKPTTPACSPTVTYNIEPHNSEA